ncbi:NATD1 [Cordylochernes scorpioides]|uniref:Protein NATD1 n=1 Tax=Cordylochernes scorpioides TaxID=51811 RepID=A0ABY6KJJ1_9ARAC|nr:NATD1 [Cordylochernes scorpioides]
MYQVMYQAMYQAMYQVMYQAMYQAMYQVMVGSDCLYCTALLQYNLLNSGAALDLVHTEVPSSLRGQGVAQHLVKAALDHVVEKDLKVRLTCTYCQKYVASNPDPKLKPHLI